MKLHLERNEKNCPSTIAYDESSAAIMVFVCSTDEQVNEILTAVNFHDRLVEQVKKLEWCDGCNVTDGEGGTCYVRACPSCSGAAHENFTHGLGAESIGHRADCKLAALLKELEG